MDFEFSLLAISGNFLWLAEVIEKASLENNGSKAGFPIKSSNVLSSLYNVVCYFQSLRVFLS